MPTVKELVLQLVRISDELTAAGTRLGAEQAAIAALQAELATIIQEHGDVIFSNAMFAQLVEAYLDHQNQ